MKSCRFQKKVVILIGGRFLMVPPDHQFLPRVLEDLYVYDVGTNIWTLIKTSNFVDIFSTTLELYDLEFKMILWRNNKCWPSS